MTAPLDLDAIRARANEAREVWNGPDTYGIGPRALRASAADVPALLAEVERLRAESVPRSALVAVGWECSGRFRERRHGEGIVCECQPVYVIREDTDGR